MSYNDILSMPTYERRYFLGMLTKEASEKQEELDKIREEAKNNPKGSKGQRSTRVSGEALKNKMKSGEIPTT
jgi:hypothetical protein